RDERGGARGLPRERDRRPVGRAAALRRLERVLPPRGRLARQGRARHHPRAPVPQGRDVLLLRPCGRRGGAPAPARLGGADAASRRPAVPRHRHRRGRPRVERRAQVRLRGVAAHAAALPRAHVDVELHDVPGAPPQRARARRGRRQERDAHRRDAQRHARHDALDRRDPRAPPAGRRLGPRAGGPASVPRGPRGARAGGGVTGPLVPDDAPGPMLVALDIDGTLMSYDQELSEDVRDAVAGLRAAGHHVVLASGRSLIAMTPVAEILGIDRGWVVASNGAVTARLDPEEPDGYALEDVVTFDPGPALRLLREHLPDARYAVEDVGVGFRMNELFPDGELDGVHRVVEFDELWSGEVTRVIVRSPGSTSEEFHELVEHLGLDDVTYAVGWTAWMDIAPLGVTKATGLELVRRVLHVQPHRTVAVGDGRNDVEMLRWAAHGVAMGHADAVVQEAADEVTGTIDDDGAADVLRGLLPAG